ncbi:hypothetical protein FHS41_005558 [Streptomyces violarus]|uniref:Uncharacterized protein n=1 Tax=Streptomyces violarus TaxID=67380 RepID=A0A7W4ZUL5_9ACTN|nr:hypothetical protein [Streptomyces violarus]
MQLPLAGRAWDARIAVERSVAVIDVVAAADPPAGGAHQGVDRARPRLGAAGDAVHHAQAEQGGDGRFGAQAGVGAGEAVDTRAGWP